jgi:hypothetical protein
LAAACQPRDDVVDDGGFVGAVDHLDAAVGDSLA